MQQFSLFAKVTFIILSLSLFLIVSCSKDDDLPDNNEIIVEEQLPQIIVNTNGGIIIDEPKINAEFEILINDQLNYEGNIGIELRGASSQALFPKKSYGLETRDENNEDLDVSLLGLPAEEDWILHGPYSDKSLMRNILIYDLSRDINRYASRGVFVELVINNSYKGVYVFMEKLKRDKERINIDRLTIDENSGEDLTGGYILKIDKTSGNNLGEGYNELNSFSSQYTPPNAVSDKKIRFLYEYPDAEDITSEQKNYISSYISDFEDVLASDNFTNPISGYEAYIDVPSFIDFFIFNEISNNIDGYRLSTFMHKDKGGKLKMGPIWDFNLAFGNAGYCNGGYTNVWAYKFNERCPDDFWLVPFWWERLLQDPAFVEQLKERWNSLRGSVLSESYILGKIDGYIEQLEKADAINENFKTWNILGEWIWPNNFVGTSYDDEINYLKSFITGRLGWLDVSINNL